MGQKTMSCRTALLGATMLVWGFPLTAQAVRTGIDLSAEAEATSNPYLDEDGTDWVGAGTVEIRPWLVSETATDRVELEGFARGRAFTSTYDFEDSFGGSLRASRRASARTSYYGQANVLSTSARSTFSRFNRPGFGFDLDPLTPTAPGTPVRPGDAGALPGAPIGTGTAVPGGTGAPILAPIDDITLVGLQGRTTTASVSAGINRQLDTVSSLNASVGYNRLWVSEEDAASGYESAVVNLGYQRALSARTSVGASLSAGQARYESDIPKTTTLGANATVQHRFDENWSLDASIGISNSRSDASGIYPEIDDTGIVGTLATCRTDAQSRLCLGFSRSQQPSSLGQVRTSDAIDLTYSERLSARDRVDIYINYGRSLAAEDSVEDSEIFPVDIEIATVGGSYTRAFSERLEGYAFGRASRSYGGFLSDEPSLSVGVGVRYRIGERR